MPTIIIPSNKTIYFNMKKAYKVGLITTKTAGKIPKSKTHPNDCGDQPGDEEIKTWETLLREAKVDEDDPSKKKYKIPCFDSGGFAPMPFKFKSNETSLSSASDVVTLMRKDKRVKNPIEYTTLEDMLRDERLSKSIKTRVKDSLLHINASEANDIIFVVFEQHNKDNVLAFHNLYFENNIGKTDINVEIIPFRGEYKDVNENEIPTSTAKPLPGPYKMKKIETSLCYSTVFLDFEADNNVNITKGNLQDAYFNGAKLDFTKFDKIPQQDAATMEARKMKKDQDGLTYDQKKAFEGVMNGMGGKKSRRRRKPRKHRSHKKKRSRKHRKKTKRSSHARSKRR